MFRIVRLKQYLANVWLWPVSACQARAAKQPFMNPAQLSDSAAMSPAAAVNVPVAACQSH
jgi:hypothetical protein